MRSVLLVLSVVAMPFSIGCDVIPGGLLDRTSVELVNNGDFGVDLTLFYHDDQNVLEDIITEVGEERQMSIAAGDTMSFTENCDDLQAIIIEDADLQVVGGAGPEANTDVLRDGDDFGCGDTIVFTFDHSDAVVDFAIATSTR